MTIDKIHIRNMSSESLETALDLYKSYLDTNLSLPRLEYLTSTYPAKAAYNENHEMIGFCYTNQFAPDVIELANIFLIKEMRNKRVGQILLLDIVRHAYELKYTSVILSNSSLYTSQDEKKDPTSFYVRLGFRILYFTKHTNIYVAEIASILKEHS